MARAFTGISVLDFTQVLAGPFCTQQLAMQGASVIKIEQPGSGDQTRGLMSGTDDDEGMSATYQTCNVGKRSLTLDLKHPKSAEIVRRLVHQSDVLVENFRPGVMDRLGFDYEVCRELKPDLIYCSISGYGQSGPKAHVAAYDGAVQADSGMMAITGSDASGPLRTGYMPVDMSTAINAAFAISTALYRRATTGEGQRLDIAMMDTAVVMQAIQYARFLDTEEMPERIGNRSPTGLPTANVFAANDGFLQILALKPNQVEKLFTAIDATTKLEEPAFATNESRTEHYDEVSHFINAKLAMNSTEFWHQKLLDLGVPVALVRDFSSVREDPQFSSRNVFLDNPTSDTSVDTVIGSGYLSFPDPPSISGAAPRLGEHTDTILRELNFSPIDIDAFRNDGVL